MGIDVCKATHHVCVMDESGKVCWSGKLANDQRAIEAQHRAWGDGLDVVEGVEVEELDVARQRQCPTKGSTSSLGHLLWPDRNPTLRGICLV
ncbi:transposase [Nocardia sp. NPDC050408]|uniref:IS110 family transposase n=1 Tax=Nocardia sp. NPDC050408 TaxID=3364319 RepID=UPI0037B69F36